MMTQSLQKVERGLANQHFHSWSTQWPAAETVLSSESCSKGVKEGKRFTHKRYIPFQTFVHYYFVAKLTFELIIYMGHISKDFMWASAFVPSVNIPSLLHLQLEIGNLNCADHIQSRGNLATTMYAYTFCDIMNGIFLTKTWVLLSLYFPVSNNLTNGRRVKGTR